MKIFNQKFVNKREQPIIINTIGKLPTAYDYFLDIYSQFMQYPLLSNNGKHWRYLRQIVELLYKVEISNVEISM